MEEYMTSTEHGSSTRILFLDNVKYMVILMVVTFHVALSYCNLTPWWWVVDPKKSVVIDNIVLIFDVFLMPVMFFVAGYFALPSLKKRGGLEFIVEKFRRLGIPWLLGVTFIGPILTYIQHYTRSVNESLTPSGYGQFWLEYMKTAFDFPLGKYSRSAGQFSQHHFWFLSQLVFFFVLLAVVYAFKQRIAKTPAKSQPDISSLTFSPSMALIVFGMIIFAGLSIILQFIQDLQYLTIFHLLQFRPSMFYITLCYFVFGVFVYSKGMFANGANLGKLHIWIPVCVVVSIIYLKYIVNLLTTPEPSLGFELAVTFTRVVVGLSILVILTTFTKVFMNRPSAINSRLSASSFYIYIVHSLFVLPLAMLFLPWQTPVLIKFGTVSLLSIALSFGFSYYLVRPHPKVSVVVLIALFLLMVLGINPA